VSIVVPTRSYSLSNDKVLKVTGPAKIVVRRGSVYIFGKVVNQGEEFVVKSGYTYAVVPCGEAEVDVTSPILPDEICDPNYVRWKDVILRLSDESSKVVVVGHVDVGKTSFCLQLANAIAVKDDVTIV